jgi:uncharacterized protein (TIGR02466 family)|tara:strand:+ start:64 stop:657 length:594 start_codon:yes stop_codon:yes gene_type:complete
MIKTTMFTTSVYEKTNFLNKYEIEKLNNIIEKNQTFKEHKYLIGNAVSSYDHENQFLDNVVDIKKEIQKEINVCSKMISYDSIELTNSWSNIQRKGSSIKYHCHPNSIVSGVLFLEVDEHSSKIYFKNPNQMLLNCDFKENNSDNFEYFFIVPQPGMLLMWPSWLMHGSNDDINNSEKRTVISFNTFYKKNKGKGRG